MALQLQYAQTLIASTSKAATQATKTGKLNLSIISLYNMIAYYVEFTRGKQEWNQEHAYLIDKLVRLKYMYPKVLCNYKTVLPGEGTSPPTNTAPVVDNNSYDMLATSLYQFKVSDFTLNYTDAESHPYKFLTIYPNANAGVDGSLAITSGGAQLTNPITINIEGLAGTTLIDLYYTRIDPAAFGPDTIDFKVSDNPIDYLYSATKTFSISATIAEVVGNQPATIGDNTIYADNRETTVLTLAMFTTGLTPPYNDPEADLIDAIRIDEISDANVGLFYYNGTAIQVGDIITREELAAGDLIHIGPDQDAISSDVFNFSARDEGSQIWVE